MTATVGHRRYLVNFEPARLPHLFVDVLVLGGGVAGLRAALEAAETSEVLLVCKAGLDDSNTAVAQGGIAAALDPADSPEKHAADTLALAEGLADERVVHDVAAAAPRVIQELASWGAHFDRHDSTLALGREGAHSMPRIVHARGDATGRELVRVLAAQVRDHPRIRVFEHCFAIDLLTDDGCCVGAITWHAKYGLQMFWATTTILATGGVGAVYRETTNPPVATGDGLAMALRAGAVLRDLEFVQFHPTTLYVAGAARALISEAVRGEGAYLRNRAGERFMLRYDERGELAPRDIVSRAIHSEMRREHFTHVFLDVRHFEPGRFARRFPTIDALCRQFDIHPERDLIPVRPSAHYMVGGVRTDPMGRTRLPGLLACGEVASSGLHGANRLASNSLLEGLVIGRRAGRLAAQRTLEQTRTERPAAIGHVLPRSPRTALDIDDVRHSLRSIMSRNVAIVRSGDRLDETREIIEFWSRYVMDKVFDDPRGWETQNLLTVALAITLAAAARCESRGVHYRQDHPGQDPHWTCHTEIRRVEDALQVCRAPVGAEAPAPATTKEAGSPR